MDSIKSLCCCRCMETAVLIGNHFGYGRGDHLPLEKMKIVNNLMNFNFI